jgi:hypothetical protein
MKEMWQIRLRGVVQRMTRGEGNACLLQDRTSPITSQNVPKNSPAPDWVANVNQADFFGVVGVVFLAPARG